MDNVLFEVVGRPYGKTVLMRDGFEEYKAECMGNYNLICEKFYQKASVSAEKIEFVQLIDNSGYMIYSKFTDPFSGKKCCYR